MDKHHEIDCLKAQEVDALASESREDAHHNTASSPVADRPVGDAQDTPTLLRLPLEILHAAVDRLKEDAIVALQRTSKQL